MAEAMALGSAQPPISTHENERLRLCFGDKPSVITSTTR